MTVTNRGNSRVEIQATSGSRTNSATADMDELDSNLTKLKIFAEDNFSLAPSSTEPVFLEEAHYSSVRAELEADAFQFKPESWSSAVDPLFAKKQKKEVIKRQDVIYELMQTEMRHVRTLKIMLKVYCHALREELHWNKEINQLLPCLDELLELHEQFLVRFKERRRESLEEGSDQNYIIQKIGDILVQQFSGDAGERMKDSYGVFCSQHNRAVGHYKVLMRENKKFQNLMKKIGNSSIVRRLGVPECILLVTQRITKYPVLVERIIQNTEDGTEDYEALTQALTLIKETITEIDLRIHKSEKGQRLDEIIAKMEPKSSGKLKNGVTFRKHNMENRQLLYDGMLYWKTASGRLKDILAVLLTDVLLLLQEKDQKFIFSSVDAKPPVISLQKLIVREVANEEKAMFLISASLKGPEMYEIHTASKEERNTWMTLIRGAVESCPDEEEITNEADIERKHAYERAVRMKDCQERLNMKDAYIMQMLNEKLQLYIDMAELYGLDDSSQGPKMRLLIGSDGTESLQGENTLLSAIVEAEKIFSMLLCFFSNPHEDTSTGICSLPRRSETFGGYDCTGSSKSGSFKQRVKEHRTISTASEGQTQDVVLSESEVSMLENNNLSTSQESELIGKMQTLLQLLYSLQAIVTQQDSCFEVQREHEKQLRQQSTRGNWLLEQEKQRNFEKQREELANVQKQQEQLKQEKQRWERERTKLQKEMEAADMRLRQREETSRFEKEKLDQERSELEKQRQAYQHDLERLREAQRAVEKDRERLEQLKKIKISGSAGSFSPDLVQVTLGLTPSSSFNGDKMQNLEGAAQSAMKPLAKISASHSQADYVERPEVMRRDSSSTDTRPTKNVPIHLLSATNQIQKQALPTRQQIPTKLAALSKSGKEKPSRGKASHRTDSSASIDHRQLYPCKSMGKDESTVRSRRSASPSLTNSLITLFPQDSSGQEDIATEPPPYNSNLYRQSSANLLTPSIPPPTPPAPATEEDINKEDVIFF